MSQAPSSILVPLDLTAGPSAIDYMPSDTRVCPILGFLCVAATGAGTIKLTPYRATDVQIGGSGTGARLRVTADAIGQITAVEIASGGSGYGTGPVPVSSITDPYGTGASITLFAAGGSVTAATVASPGLGYSGYVQFNIADFVDGVNYNICPRFIEQTGGTGSLTLIGNKLPFRPYQVF